MRPLCLAGTERRQMRDDEGVDRTDRILKNLIRLVVLPGFAAATYLTYTKLFDVPIACGPSHGCGVVATSEWSELFGIPVTLLGMLTYIAIFASTFFKHENAKLLAAFLAVIGVCFSGWLQYQSLFVMKHACPYCITSAIAMLLLSFLTVWRVLRIPDFGDGEDFADADAGTDDGGDAVATA